jgi:serine/threonine-protein kinase
MGVLLVLLIGGLVIWYVTRADNKTVPTVIGMQVDPAINTMQDKGFKVQIQRAPNARPPGIVFSQNPAPGTNTDKGSTVRLFVSSGKRTIKVPNVDGRSQADASDALVKEGFTVTIAQVFSSQPAGTVVAQDPPAGTQAPPGSRVRISVSKGPANVEVPSEVGTTVDQARAGLAAKGFRVAVTLVPSDQPAGTVVAQNPAGGAAPKGSTVQLNVSQGPTATATTTTTTDTTTTATVPTTPGTTTTGAPTTSTG